MVVEEGQTHLLTKGPEFAESVPVGELVGSLEGVLEDQQNHDHGRDLELVLRYRGWVLVVTLGLLEERLKRNQSGAAHERYRAIDVVDDAQHLIGIGVGKTQDELGQITEEGDVRLG